MLPLTDKRIGFALCGSFCTLRAAIDALKKLSASGADIYPVMSPIVYSTNTRFGTAEGFKNEIKEICKKDIIHTVDGAEPIGPKKMLDLLIIAPCTGNTLGKLANGITDTSVTMAAKAHLRNERPLLIAVSTNDALSGSAQNIGRLMNTRGIFFVPFSEDNAESKPRSCIARLETLQAAASAALEGRQLQPIIS